ncbi:MAG: ribonuclease HI family protein [Chloroflexi bacterium]|nr:ribonuclease HI family protein [Chloroflexota bacterium]MCI0728538.1 ribonuclease HI family protein [Chloroflexota bacterium]
MKKLSIHVDGAVGDLRHAGVAAVARTNDGQFLGWLSRQLRWMTNNEAEYNAALLGLELARLLGAQQVEIVSDSEVVVLQMQGKSRVNSARLKTLHRQACDRVARFPAVTFRHVPREQNSLADALATEAMLGRTVRMPPVGERVKI